MLIIFWTMTGQVTLLHLHPGITQNVAEIGAPTGGRKVAVEARDVVVVGETDVVGGGGGSIT